MSCDYLFKNGDVNEVTFRGQRVDTGDWVYGSLYHDEYENRNYIVIKLIFESQAGTSYGKLKGWGYEVRPDTVEVVKRD